MTTENNTAEVVRQNADSSRRLVNIRFRAKKTNKYLRRQLQIRFIDIDDVTVQGP